MNFIEMNDSLPNGLHDAQVETIRYDLLDRVILIQVFVWVGTMADPPETRERYRRGLMRFGQTAFFAKSAPYDGSDLQTCILQCGQNKDLDWKSKEPATPETYRFFTGYCEIDIESKEFNFEWLEDEVNCWTEG